MTMRTVDARALYAAAGSDRRTRRRVADARRSTMREILTELGRTGAKVRVPQIKERSDLSPATIDRLHGDDFVAPVTIERYAEETGRDAVEIFERILRGAGVLP